MENMSVEELAALLRTAILRNGKTWNETAVEILKTLDEQAEYEYAVQIITGPRAGELVPLWSDREDRQDFIDDLYAYSDAHNYKLVKRRKAGRIEDV